MREERKADREKKILNKIKIVSDKEDFVTQNVQVIEVWKTKNKKQQSYPLRKTVCV